jgi:hypothetical protein
MGKRIENSGGNSIIIDKTERDTQTDICQEVRKCVPSIPGFEDAGVSLITLDVEEGYSRWFRGGSTRIRKNGFSY